MKKENKYDERQIAEQMKAYRSGFLVSLAIAIVMYFLTDFCYLEIENSVALRIYFWIPFFVAEVRMILNDAYLLKGQQFFLHFTGVMGVIIVVMSIIGLYQEKGLQEGISLLLMGTSWVVSDIIYLVKQRQNAKFRDESTEL